MKRFGNQRVRVGNKVNRFGNQMGRVGNKVKRFGNQMGREWGQQGEEVWQSAGE